MPATPNIIDQLGTSWKLHVQEHATFSYDHPTFGLLEYTGTEAWLCDNVNTLSLTSQGNLPDGVLPQKVCIRPKYDGKCGCYDTVIYPTASEQCECGDNGCPQTHTLWLRCNDCFESNTQTIGRAVPGIGRECSNPSYSMTSSLCGQTLLVTWYCCGGGWLADVTLNGNFCGTYSVPLLSKCPLVIGVGTSNCSYSYYNDCDSFCVGIDQPCEPISTTCCDPPWPSVVDVLLSSTCAAIDGQTVTLTATSSNTYHGEITLGCGDLVTVDLTTCISGMNLFGGVVNLYASTGELCLAGGGGTGTMTCDPPSLGTNTGTFTDIDYSKCDCGCLVTDTVSLDLV